MYTVYILYSPSHNVYYKGYSSDLEKRLIDHNTGKSRYTSTKLPWTLVFTQSFDSKTDAIKRESQLKKQNRRYLEWLITSDINELG